MKRDGATTSLWQKDIAAYESKTLHLPRQTFDIIIAGGGVTGITTALELQKAGKKCLVVEAHTLCFGTTGGTTAHLNTYIDTAYQQIKKDFGEDAIQLMASATRKAIQLYKSNVDSYNIDCGFEEKEGYVFSKNAKQTEELNKLFEASALAGLDVRYADTISMPFEFEKAMVFPAQAQVHPTKYVFALAAAFEKAGGIIVQHCAVEDVVEKEGGVVVQTTLGAVEAHFLIYATHIPPKVNLLHFRCAPYRSYAIAIKLEQQYDGLVYDLDEPYHYYRTQEVNGENYLIAGGEDHKTGHEQNTEACFARLQAYVSKYFPTDEIAYRWSSQYFEPADGLPYIGLLPGSSGNVLVATGFSGNGMTYSHIAAPLLTDLIIGKENACAALFSPNRIKPVAGFTSFVKENADVVGQFVKKRFSAQKITELAALAPGEGKLIKYEGEKLAVYKDLSGHVHALQPVCTHAGCIVDWNNAEKTWDCPCHGARYAIDGTVVTGPASKALEVVSLIDLLEENK